MGKTYRKDQREQHRIDRRDRRESRQNADDVQRIIEKQSRQKDEESLDFDEELYPNRKIA